MRTAGAKHCGYRSKTEDPETRVAGAGHGVLRCEEHGLGSNATQSPKKFLCWKFMASQSWGPEVKKKKKKNPGVSRAGSEASLLGA